MWSPAQTYLMFSWLRGWAARAPEKHFGCKGRCNLRHLELQLDLPCDPVYSEVPKCRVLGSETQGVPRESWLLVFQPGPVLRQRLRRKRSMRGMSMVWFIEDSSMEDKFSQNELELQEPCTKLGRFIVILIQFYLVFFKSNVLLADICLNVNDLV